MLLHTRAVPLRAVPVHARPPALPCAARNRRRAPSALHVYIHVCIHLFIHVCVSMYCAHRPRVPRSTHARKPRHTGGDECGAQQPCVRPAGADRVGVEVHRGGYDDVIAAPRVARVGLQKRRPHALARCGGGGGAARRLGLDPRGARRALVDARGAGHVRTCAGHHRTRGPRPCRSSRARMYPSGPREYPVVPNQYSAADRPPAPGSTLEYHPMSTREYRVSTP